MGFKAFHSNFNWLRLSSSLRNAGVRECSLKAGRTEEVRRTTYGYDSFFRPYLAKHETEIDRNLLELRTRTGDIAVLRKQICQECKPLYNTIDDPKIALILIMRFININSPRKSRLALNSFILLITVVLSLLIITSDLDTAKSNRLDLFRLGRGQNVACGWLWCLQYLTGLRAMSSSIESEAAPEY
ncbi:hypothetical protein HHK36_031719 [Tetracentron sinense]|uniref:Uncharacterized protein n=1 Tax=Tetracentron sinense TaxID=13715 RepID=A0A834Y6G0_TETSI|nr:hypothetical protein HHK36_031719 [Tetracentron sinense]